MMATLAPTWAVQTSATQKLNTETRVESKAIPFKVVYQFSRDVGPGRLSVSEQGKPGEVVKTFTVLFKEGKPVSKTLVSTVRHEPVDQVVLMGREGFPSSRHMYSRGRVMEMTATAYDPSPQTIPGTTGHCANGMRAGYGVIAVDPRVIPLGTPVYVEGYGFAIAADTGGAIKGNRVDLCYDSRSTALRFGRRKVRVHVLRGS